MSDTEEPIVKVLFAKGWRNQHMKALVPGDARTAIIFDERNALLWTNGFVPRLGTYIGPETPNPLSITVLHSTGKRQNIRTVQADIMGPTKINYNASNYNDGLPVTICFANKVGDVLTMGSARDAERQPLKFYV